MQTLTAVSFKALFWYKLYPFSLGLHWLLSQTLINEWLLSPKPVSSCSNILSHGTYRDRNPIYLLEWMSQDLSVTLTSILVILHRKVWQWNCLKCTPKRKNFGPDQIESICRRQIKCNKNDNFCLWKSRKRWEKGEIACTRNFSFSHNVFKRFLSQTRQKVSLCGNGLSTLPQNLISQNSSGTSVLWYLKRVVCMYGLMPNKTFEFPQNSVFFIWFSRLLQTDIWL